MLQYTNMADAEKRITTKLCKRYEYLYLKRMENAKRAAIIYLDEDSVPELLILKNREYEEIRDSIQRPKQ